MSDNTREFTPSDTPGEKESSSSSSPSSASSANQEATNGVNQTQAPSNTNNSTPPRRTPSPESKSTDAAERHSTKEMTKVVHSRSWPPNVTPHVLKSVARTHGFMPVKVLPLDGRGQAFLEFATLEEAKAFMKLCEDDKVEYEGNFVRAHPSGRPEITQREKPQSSPGKVLYVTVSERYDGYWPLQLTDFVQVFHSYNVPILRIICYREHLLVEFESRSFAQTALAKMNGKYIFLFEHHHGEQIYQIGVCKMNMQFSYLPELKIRTDNEKMMDLSRSAPPQPSLLTPMLTAAATAGGLPSTVSINRSPSPSTVSSGWSAPMAPNNHTSVQATMIQHGSPVMHSGAPSTNDNMVFHGMYGTYSTVQQAQQQQQMQQMQQMQMPRQLSHPRQDDGRESSPAGHMGVNHALGQAIAGKITPVINGTIPLNRYGMNPSQFNGHHHGSSMFTPLPPMPAPVQRLPNAVMVVNLSIVVANAASLFNLFGFYGDVLRVKLIVSPEMHFARAIIVYKDPLGVSQALHYLNDLYIAQSKIHVVPYSANPDDDPVVGHGERILKDSVWNDNFTGHRYLFSNSHNKKHICAPNRELHLSNIHDGCTENLLCTVFSQYGRVVGFRWMPNRSMAFVQFENSDQATIALMALHNSSALGVQPLKISFSQTVLAPLTAI